MKKIVISAVVGILLGATASLVQAHCGMCPGDPPAAKKEVKETTGKSTNVVMQTTCPVQGEAIDQTLYVDFEGKRIYVCCKEGMDKVAANPADYVKKLKAQGVTLAKVQTTCPVMGGKSDSKIFVDHKGKRIYLCCSGCIAVAKADPEKYIKKLEAEGIVLDTTPRGPSTNTPATTPRAPHEEHGAHHH